MAAFGKLYAKQYDQLYGDKDYDAECDLLAQVFLRHGTGDTRTLVDFGCGTGNHALVLAQRGYRVTGVDISAEMLRVAREKAAQASLDIRWVEGDIRDAQAGGPFDAGLCMFAVLGYLLKNEDVMAAFANVRRHIRAGGLFVFDLWYGPAVLTIKPSDRAKVLPVRGGQFIRLVTPSLDTRRHLCELRYHLWRLTGDHLDEESEELHLVRYFFPMELELMLSLSGFGLIALTAFPSLERSPDETTWNVLVVARAL